MRSYKIRLAVYALLAASIALVAQGLPANAATYGIIYNYSNPLSCIDDPSNSTTPGTKLVLWNGCGSLQGEMWTTVPDAFNGGGYDLIVLKNTSNGSMCIDDPGNGGKGTQLVIEPCNGLASEQSWISDCPPLANNPNQGGPEVYNGAGRAINLQGDNGANGTPIIVWTYQNPVSTASVWWGPPGMHSGLCE